MNELDPFVLFREWYGEAVVSEPDVPDAMALATVDPEGRPHVRVVLLKEATADGLVFYTNYASPKARDLDATGVAALCFHWKSRQRQVRVEGKVERVAGTESDAYFATRPFGSRLGAWASAQSEPIGSREDLLARVEAVRRRFGEDVPRPPHWGGYRLVAERYEFWQGRSDRLHDRILFERLGDAWARSRLQP